MTAGKTRGTEQREKRMIINRGGGGVGMGGYVRVPYAAAVV